MLDRYEEYDNTNKDDKYLYQLSNSEVRNAFNIIEQITYNESNQN